MCLILLCISLGMTRECAEAQEALMSCDGFSSLLRALQSSVEKLRVKAAFMLTCLCNENPVYKGDNSILFVNDPNSVFFKLLIVFADVIRFAVRYGFCGAFCSPFAAGTGRPWLTTTSPSQRPRGSFMGKTNKKRSVGHIWQLETQDGITPLMCTA